jgi:hypothetical protein
MRKRLALGTGHRHFVAGPAQRRPAEERRAGRTVGDRGRQRCDLGRGVRRQPEGTGGLGSGSGPAFARQRLGGLSDPFEQPVHRTPERGSQRVHRGLGHRVGLVQRLRLGCRRQHRHAGRRPAGRRRFQRRGLHRLFHRLFQRLLHRLRPRLLRRLQHRLQPLPPAAVGLGFWCGSVCDTTRRCRARVIATYRPLISSRPRSRRSRCSSASSAGGMRASLLTKAARRGAGASTGQSTSSAERSGWRRSGQTSTRYTTSASRPLAPCTVSSCTAPAGTWGGAFSRPCLSARTNR